MVTTTGREAAQAILQTEFLWDLGSICALYRQPFSAELVERELTQLCSFATLISVGRALHLRIKHVRLKRFNLERLVFPLLVGLAQRQEAEPAERSLRIVTAAAHGKVVLRRAGSNQPETLSNEDFLTAWGGGAWLVAPQGEAVQDPDAADATRQFGFRWFVPTLLKHRHVWRDAS